ncbi:MAG: hypothetical protein KGL39_46100, partial [Patescibacteria group bacterium]|nr:hypothetical protein [Patescibacteria group bacterium]
MNAMPVNAQKWKKAVVNLECASDSVPMADWAKRAEATIKSLKPGQMPPQAIMDEVHKGLRDIRSIATAVFLRDTNDHYLVTARHVLFDIGSASRDLADQI